MLKRKMKEGLVPFTLILIVAAIAVGREQTPQNSSAPPAQSEERSESPRPGISQASLPISGEPETLHVYVGKTLVVSWPEPLKRVSVTDPAIASANIITPNQVLIHGRLPGGVSLILWDTQERMHSFDLQVELDLNLLRQTIRQALPKESIEVSQSASSVVVTGTVSSQQAAEQAVALAQTHAENVVNLLSEVGEQVLLQIRFAEINRAALQELGVSFFGTGFQIGDEAVIGTVTTQQFDQPLANVGAVPSEVERGRDPAAPSLAAGGVGNPLEGTPAVFGLSDLLNIFLFSPSRNFGFVIRALEQRNLLEILAEPNLLAQNGREASFLAGGEFPFPVVQGISGGLPAVTIQFREFGIRLNFTPTISSDGTINLKVVNEVSALDFSNALTISGFVVPALSTRRAQTELQLRDGQSFAIAGLVDNRLIEVASKIPWLGDIPIVGKLFQSRSLQRNNTELVVFVTPKLIKPLEPGESAPIPAFPKPFLDKEEFDREKGKKPPEEEPPQDEPPQEEPKQP